jgi:putative hydrolase of the HAD superfamily
LKYFSVLVFSEDVGLGKPAPGVFLEACRQAGEDPDACVHIGDSIEADVDPSRALGMQAIWLDRHASATSKVHAPVISTLHDLDFVLNREMPTVQLSGTGGNV